MHRLALAALLLGAATSSAAAPLTPYYCPVTIYPDFNYVFGYYSTVRLSLGCPLDGYALVRKSSTLNTHLKGNPVQPVKPLKGGWLVTHTYDDIPNNEQFTSYFSTWTWQFYDGRQWKAAAQP